MTLGRGRLHPAPGEHTRLLGHRFPPVGFRVVHGSGSCHTCKPPKSFSRQHVGKNFGLIQGLFRGACGGASVPATETLLTLQRSRKQTVQTEAAPYRQRHDMGGEWPGSADSCNAGRRQCKKSPGGTLHLSDTGQGAWGGVETGAPPCASASSQHSCLGRDPPGTCPLQGHTPGTAAGAGTGQAMCRLPQACDDSSEVGHVAPGTPGYCYDTCQVCVHSANMRF